MVVDINSVGEATLAIDVDDMMIMVTGEEGEEVSGRELMSSEEDNGQRRRRRHRIGQQTGRGWPEAIGGVGAEQLGRKQHGGGGGRQ